MSDTDVDTDLDSSNFILRDQRRTMANAVTSLQDDPEKATRATQLGAATGDSPSIIYPNLEDYEAQHKATLTAGLLNSNQFLRQYIDADSMHAKISNDDYGQLDAASEAITPLTTASRLEKWLEDDSISRSFKEGFGEQPIDTRRFYSGYATQQDIDWALRNPAVASLYGPIAQAKGLAEIGFEGLSRVTSGLLHMGFDGMSAIFGESFARDMTAMAELALMRGDLGTKSLGGGATGPLGRIEQNAQLWKGLHNSMKVADEYVRADMIPPPGVDPLIDKAKTEQAKIDGDALKDALTESTKSATRERSPEAYASFVRQHVGEREIGIDAEAVRKLYGDKVPEAGDNLLGWIPDLAERLASAEGIGGDLRVPLADWLAYVDKDVAKELHDNIRVRDGGLTLEEAKNLGEPKEVIADPLQLARGAAGFEPQFALGDRKVTLQRMKVKPSLSGLPDSALIAGGFHDFDLLDETGKKIGSLNLSEQKEGKQLYVEMIQAGKTEKMYDPNFLGPAIIRDLGRQIKAEFPKAFGPDGLGITGHRVSGAREKAGVEMTAPMPVIKLSQDAPEGWGHIDAGPTLRELFAEIGGQTIETQGAGDLHYSPTLEPHKLALDKAIRDELDRIAPKQAQVFTPEQIGVPDRPGFARRGFHQQFREQDPWIVVALDSPNAMGVARHEAIHHLRQQGFFSEGEWSTLERAARQNDWKSLHGIEERYKDLSEDKKLEESIAEAYRTWKDATDKKLYPPGINAIFQKLQDFFEALRLKVKEITGKDLSWDEIFQQVDTGKVGAREGNAPLKQGAFRAMDEPIEGLFDKAKAMGVTEAHMNRMMKLIAKRNEEDLAKATARAERQQKRSQTTEWKNRRTEIRDDVREQLGSRPDLATDELFATQKIKLNPDYLSEEQKAALPKDYVQRKDGVNPDDLAPYFGYTSGDALVERLGMLTSDRRSAGMSQRDYFNRLVDVETDRRLNAEFGDLNASIMDAAKDQALSETQLDLVHEETLAYALAAGQEPKFTKEQVREMVKGQFDLTPVRDISSDRLIQTAGKLGRKIEEASSKGDWAEAYRISQQRNYATIAAKFAREYEKAQTGLDRTAKTFRKREVPSVAQEYTNWVHDLLMRVGYPINRSVQDLAENVGRASEGSIKEFMDAKEAEWLGMRELPVADFLLDPVFRKELKDLTYQEFIGFKSSIDTLVKAGRDEKKIYREGEAADKETLLGQFREKLKTFGYKPSNVKPGMIGQWPRLAIYGMTSPETAFNRWDRGDPLGVFNRFFSYPLAAAANGKAALQREIAKAYDKLSKPKDLDKLVTAPFPDPLTRTPENPEGTGPWEGFNRGNVLQMLNNAGNKSNWNKLSRGYGVDPEQLMSWLVKNTTKEDWDRAQQLGNSVFKKLIALADKVYERMTGATIQKIRLEPIETPYGTYEGWYHPLDADPVRKTVWSQDKETGQWSQHAQGKRETLSNDDFFHFSTSNGYTQSRTGAIYPLNLEFNMAPVRISQMIHDINFREVIHETQKIFSDPRFQEDVAKYYGSEYADGLMPYLRRLAGGASIDSRNAAKGAKVSELLRQNVVSTYIGGNIYTMMKHGPTALIFSMREVGIQNFASAVKDLYAVAPEARRDANKFIKDNFEEVNRRERHWQETVGAQGKAITGEANWREQIIQWGSAGVAWSDMVSAKPTAWAAFNKYRAEGLSKGDSINLADRAVRRPHGSTAETNLPPMVAGTGDKLHPWLTTVYGFFGTAMQRRIETAHKLNDTHKLLSEGEFNAASKKAWSAFGDFMTYMVWPTIVEELVTGIGSDDHKTLGMKLIHGATMGAASSVLYLRDLVHGLVSGHEPGVGLASSALHDVGNVFRDFSRGREALSKQHAGKTIGDLLTFTGEMTGRVPKIIGNIAHYGTDVFTGQAKPKTLSDVGLGLTKGTQKRRIEK